MAKYLTAAQVQDRYQVSRSTLYRWQTNASVRLPPPVKIGHRILWREDDLDVFDAALHGSHNDDVI